MLLIRVLPSWNANYLLMPLFKLYACYLIFFLLSCGSASKEQYSSIIFSRVISVTDGDTIDLLYDGKPLRIRLAHIDCPELKKRQPFGKDAKQLTAALCFGSGVKVLNDGKFDRYGRLIGVIINSNNQNVNKEILRAGLAWHYKRYSSDTAYSNLEVEARNCKVGLWRDAAPTPPWEWRKGTGQHPATIVPELPE